MQILRYHLENVRTFLSNHWAIRLLVVPVLALATVVAAFGVATRGSLAEVATIVGIYVALSIGTVVAGLALEVLLDRVTDGSGLGP